MFLLAAVIGSVSAQTPEDRKGPCFRGKPLPKCEVFWITECAVLYRLDESGYDDWFKQLYYNWEIGYMVNRNEQNAIGGALLIVHDDMIEDTRIGIKFRYRYWLNHRVGLDVNPGLLFGGEYRESPGVQVSLAIMDQSMFGGNVIVEYYRYKGGANDFAWYAGLRFGSTLGIVAGIAIPVILVLIVASEMDMSGMSDFDLHW
ncbi:MAG: hypothetical protein JW763_11140 [candidate division Zixibacteria bacterium]|nr:hypothetical protein [candidate division Zixibacteria bacterium]